MSILVVDDSLTQRIALKNVLSAAGYRDIHLAGSAPEAFCLLGMDGFANGGEARQDINLILMDIHMPDIDGIEACSRIKAVPDLQDIPVIMVSASGEMDDLASAFHSGAMDYITKPPNGTDLQVRVRSALLLKSEIDGRKARERDLIALNHRLENVLQELSEKHSQLEIEKSKSEKLLLNVLPKPVADRLKRGQHIIADYFKDVTVLFADIVDFTPLSAAVSPGELVSLLNKIFSEFDAMVEKRGAEKIKTIGDSYMAVAGLTQPHPQHAAAIADLAMDMLEIFPEISGTKLQLRIGIHSGPVVAGVVGTSKYIYDLWGDTVNTASRLETLGKPSAIQVSEKIFYRLSHAYEFEPRGAVPIKGKGEMNTYWLIGRK